MGTSGRRAKTLIVLYAVSPEIAMGEPSPHVVTRLLAGWSHGDRAAFDELLPLVYDELHTIAARRLRHEAANHTLQPTALVHEAYVKMVDQRRVQWKNRAHFFCIAAQVMRRILVDHARNRHAAKRGRGELTLSLDCVEAAQPREISLLALDDALTQLQAMDPLQSQIVELRYFGGLTIEETALVVGVSKATIGREWNFAKAWLYRELARL